MAIIYHITSLAELNLAKETGFYTSPSLKAEGFIHCSEERQIQAVLSRYFKGEKELVKLVLDTNKLTSPLYFDWSASVEDTFPHIYGPINLDAIQEVVLI